MLRVLIVALVVLVAAMFLLPRGDRDAPPQVATVLPQGLPLPDVQLIDQAGHEFGLGELRGNFTLLFFGFTNCPDICPLTLKVLADARAEIATRAPQLKPRVVFVSVDPARDSPETIAAYLRNFDPEFLGVTATEAQLEPLLKTLGVSVQKHQHGGANYTVVHNSTVYVISPRAEMIAVSSAPHDPATIAADYLKIHRRYQAAQRTPAA